MDKLKKYCITFYGFPLARIVNECPYVVENLPKSLTLNGKKFILLILSSSSIFLLLLK